MRMRTRLVMAVVPRASRGTEVYDAGIQQSGERKIGHEMDEKIVVDKMPMCNFKHIYPTEAKYDAKTKVGPWVYMCQAHFDVHGIGLGLGKGQELVLKEVK